MSPNAAVSFSLKSLNIRKEQAMERKQKQSEEPVQQPKPMKTKILVEHSFGNGDLMELFSDYVAEKIRSGITESEKKTKEMTA